MFSYLTLLPHASALGTVAEVEGAMAGEYPESDHANVTIRYHTHVLMTGVGKCVI
jgi:hypothetical protein